MNDMDCTAFLQWALPQLDLHWPGFRKVRGQVCKRLQKRMSELGLNDFAAYRSRLAADPAEWQVLDECCHITISSILPRQGRVRIGAQACASRHRRACRTRTTGGSYLVCRLRVRRGVPIR